MKGRGRAREGEKERVRERGVFGVPVFLVEGISSGRVQLGVARGLRWANEKASS